MSVLEERCIHQGVVSGHHALFNEKWERCKNCCYDPENNKRCPDYIPSYTPVFQGHNLNYSTVLKTEEVRV